MKTTGLAFIDYWDAVDDAMTEEYGVDTMDVGIDTEELARAQDAYQSPKEFVEWFGEKYQLIKKANMNLQKATSILNPIFAGKGKMQ